MDREEAIEAIIKEVGYLVVCGNNSNFKDAINAILDQLQPQWISVKERLPELYQPVVLLNVEKFENTGGGWIRHWQSAGYLNELGRKYWSTNSSIRGESLESYTHWMPLPEAPK